MNSDDVLLVATWCALAFAAALGVASGLYVAVWALRASEEGLWT